MDEAPEGGSVYSPVPSPVPVPASTKAELLSLDEDDDDDEEEEEKEEREWLCPWPDTSLAVRLHTRLRVATNQSQP